MDRRAFLVCGSLGGAAVVAGGAVGAAGGTTLRAVHDRHAKEGAEKDGRGHGATRVVYSMATEERAVALSFDDGPHPRLTPPLLDLLEGRQVPATFFVVAEAAERFPQIVRRIVADGHEVGNHSWSHPHLSDLSAEDARDQVKRGTASLAGLVGTAPRWFRPPRGVLTGPVIHAATLQKQDIAMWSVSMPAHAPLAGRNALADKLMAQMQPGAIIDLHDGTNGREDVPRWEDLWKRQLAELGPFLDAAQGAGYRFVTMSQLDEIASRARSGSGTVPPPAPKPTEQGG